MSVPIEDVRAFACTIPTDSAESDGALEWTSTTIVVAEARGGGRSGIGYTYSDASAAPLVATKLATSVRGRDAMDVSAAWWSMVGEIRNLGRPGIASSAIAAVDGALWDLKAKILDLPLVDLFGAVRGAADRGS